jgi:hypothetical protein
MNSLLETNDFANRKSVFMNLLLVELYHHVSDIRYESHLIFYS